MLRSLSKISVILLFICGFTAHGQQYTVRYILSGKVTDFNGKPIDSALVDLKKSDFTTAASTITGSDGKYTLTVDEGKYMLMTCIRTDEYPASSELNSEDQRLRFLGWNIIVNASEEIDIRYHRLEINGVNIFRIPGSAPGFMIYCRPVSLTRAQKSENDQDFTPDPENLEVQVEVNGRQVRVNSIQRIEEYNGKNSFLYAYLLQVAPPGITGKNYDFFRILMRDKLNGDTGEAIYFKEKDGYW